MTGVSPDEPDEKVLFYIEGPDDRGCVWIHGVSSADPWARNLGAAAEVAAVLSQWLDDRGQLETMTRPEVVENEKRLAKRLRKEARPKDHRDEGGQG